MNVVKNKIGFYTQDNGEVVLGIIPEEKNQYALIDTEEAPFGKYYDIENQWEAFQAVAAESPAYYQVLIKIYALGAQVLQGASHPIYTDCWFSLFVFDHDSEGDVFLVNVSDQDREYIDDMYPVQESQCYPIENEQEANILESLLFDGSACHDLCAFVYHLGYTQRNKP